MSDIVARVYEYRLPLLEALPRQAESNLHANGLLVALSNSDGHVGYGELAEASLFGHEEYGVAKKQMVRSLSTSINEATLAPVRWAIDSAKINLRLAQSGQKFAETLNRKARPTVLLNALLDVGRPDLVDKGMRFFAEGYRTFKIKVGDTPLHEEISRIRELLSVLGTEITLRLDANRGLQLEQAVEMAHSLKKANIEYFEEPFSNLEAIEKFYALTGIRVALDESTLTPDFEPWCAHPAVSAYVLKPSRIGSIDEVLQIIERAYKCGRYFVVTSTYESGIGLTSLVNIASLWQEKVVAMGLATSRYFASDFLAPPLRPFRGQFFVQTTGMSQGFLNLEESVVCQRIFECKI